MSRSLRADRILAVAMREFIERVRSKWFLIGTLLGPALLGLMMFLPILLAGTRREDQTRIAVHDASGLLLAPLRADVEEEKLRDGRPRFVFEEVAPGPKGEEALREELGQRIEGKSLDGFLSIPADVLETNAAELRSRNVGDFLTTERVERALSKSVVRIRLEREGVSADRADGLVRRVEVRTIQVRKGQEKESGFLGTYMMTVTFMTLLYMTIYLYGISVMRGVMQEKTSRVAEVLLSSVRPFDLLAGKVIGIGAVGLVQYAVWGLVAAVLGVQGAALSVGRGLEQGSVPVPPASTLVFFVVFFVLGYFLFAASFAAIGAICRNDQEAQQAMMPLTLVLISPMILMLLILKQPDGTAVTILSLIPVFTPTIMFARIVIQPPPAWQIALSIALTLGATVLLTWIASRIYRVGLLATGSRPTVRELWKWFRTA